MRLFTSFLIVAFMLCGWNASAQNTEEITNLINKANEQMDEGKKSLAKETIQKAYVLDPDNQEVLALKGFIHYEMDEYEEAVKFYTRLLMLDDTHAEGFYYRGMAYTDLKQTEKACEDFTKAKELGYKLARIQHQQFCM